MTYARDHTLLARVTASASKFRERLADAFEPVARLAVLVRDIGVASLERLGPGSQRAVAVGLVGLLQLSFLALLLIGLRPFLAREPNETTLHLVGGPAAARSLPPLVVKLLDPAVVPIPPPVVPDEDAPSVRAAPVPSGSPDVTSPATALVGSHLLLPLPARFKRANAEVLLVLTVDQGGTISEGRVAQSCGIAELDAIALAWVKAHWRYKAALKNGVAITTDTTTIFRFGPTSGS